MSRPSARRVLGTAVREAGRLREVPVAPLACRGLMLLTGAAALVIAPGGRLVLPGLVALVAAPALLGAVLNPDGPGPAVVLGAAAAAWTVRYGVAAAPLGATLALAVALVLHHATAALGAAIGLAGRVEPAVVLRWAGQVGAVLALAGALAAAVRWLGHPPASVPLELAGLVAVVLVAAVPVLLRRG